MRRTLELLVGRVLRTRLGVAVILAVLVFGIVGGAKLMAGHRDNTPALGAVPAAPLVTVTPTGDDDGLAASDPPAAPVTRPGTAEPAQVARSFTAAWLHHRGVTAARWHDALLPYATQKLADQLSGVDPAGVPADRITGDPALVPHDPRFVDVVIPLDSGQVTLNLIAPEGHWLVDGVDWSRS